MENFIQAENFVKIIPFLSMFRDGLLTTVLLSIFTVIIGFVLALLLSIMRMCNFRPFLMLAHAFPKAFGFFERDKEGMKRDQGFVYHLGRFNPLSFLATAYVEILRSTPVVVQIMIIYYGVFTAIKLPAFTMFGSVKFNRFFPGVVALGLNSGAYLCEIIRSGVQSVDGGQTEAARSLGLKQVQNLRYIVFPQALKNILPAIANEFVVIIKESAITWTIGVPDIMYAVNAIRGSAFIIMEPLLVATGLYFCLCFPTSKLIAYFERRMRRGDVR
jgi:polar amino acid transport system permease protein